MTNTLINIGIFCAIFLFFLTTLEFEYHNSNSNDTVIILHNFFIIMYMTLLFFLLFMIICNRDIY